MAAFTLRVVGFFGCGKVKSTTAEPSESPLKQLSSRSSSLQPTRPGGYPDGEGYQADEANATRTVQLFVHREWFKRQTKEREGEVTI